MNLEEIGSFKNKVISKLMMVLEILLQILDSILVSTMSTIQIIIRSIDLQDLM